MRRRIKIRSAAAHWGLPVLTGMLAAGIFVLDTVIDLEIAVDVLYVVVVLLSVSFCQARGILLVSAICIGLTVLSHFVAPTGEPLIGLINDGLGLLAILATTYLVLRMKASEAATYAARTQLAHVSRMTTLGELTTMIAHEINQPLAAIVTNGNACLRWLRHKPPNLSEANQAAERIVASGVRASDVIVRIRDFSKRTHHEREWLDINRAIRDIVGLITAEIQQNRITLRMRLAEDLPRVLGDRVEIQQVMLNLLLNAFESVASTAEGTREVLVSTGVDPSGEVCIAVRDAGAGLDEHARERLFEPFYTTKPEGMGMGLAISRSIVEAHGGRIWAEANVPRGAVVQVTLPSQAGSTKRPYSAAKVAAAE